MPRAPCARGRCATPDAARAPCRRGRARGASSARDDADALRDGAARLRAARKHSLMIARSRREQLRGCARSVVARALVGRASHADCRPARTRAAAEAAAAQPHRGVDRGGAQPPVRRGALQEADVGGQAGEPGEVHRDPLELEHHRARDARRSARARRRRAPRCAAQYAQVCAIARVAGDRLDQRRERAADRARAAAPRRRGAGSRAGSRGGAPARRGT